MVNKKALGSAWTRQSTTTPFDLCLIFVFGFFLLATPVTPMGLVNPEPKTREEMLKCESMALHTMKPFIEPSVKSFLVQSLH